MPELHPRESVSKLSLRERRHLRPEHRSPVRNGCAMRQRYLRRSANLRYELYRRRTMPGRHVLRRHQRLDSGRLPAGPPQPGTLQSCRHVSVRRLQRRRQLRPAQRADLRAAQPGGTVPHQRLQSDGPRMRPSQWRSLRHGRCLSCGYLFWRRPVRSTQRPDMFARCGLPQRPMSKLGVLGLPC